MKEKIGKLLELLNEYHHFNSDLIGYFYDNEYDKFYFRTELPEEQKKKLGDALIDDGIDEQRVDNEWICSKKFGFIKWLVENNKIDIDEINNNHLDIEIFYKQTYGPNYGEGGYGEVGYWYKCIGLYESLLCNLAISDTPIDDLISYLK